MTGAGTDAPLSVPNPDGVPGIAVVIVTHETKSEVLGCLASLQSQGADEIIVVDNASTDGTAQAIRDRWPDVRVLELANAGFGRGANAGVRLTTVDRIAIANADTRFGPGALQGLAAAIDRDASVAAVGPAVYYPDGRPQASARRHPDPITALGHALFARVWPTNRWTRRYRAEDLSDHRPREADWLSGCVFAVRRRSFIEIGGFDPGYHLYVEDLDLGHRLRQAGWVLRYFPAVWVHHHGGASTSSVRWRALITHARSLNRFLRQDGIGLPRGVRTLLRPALTAWAVTTWVLERLLGHRQSITGEPIDVAQR